MDWTTLIFISSGLFLGCSLGANDAANVFGTAVGSRMVKFSTAAIVASIFVILGATISGAGTVRSLGALGNINELGGSFIVALSAAITVVWMTRLQPPVSTGQAIIGAIVGWNLFSGTTTDTAVLTSIASSWVLGPVLSAITAIILYLLVKKTLDIFKPHLLDLDRATRIGLVLAGAFGSYSLGANNIGNVMGVFVNSSPFSDVSVAGFTLSSIQQLFLIGGLAIASGIFLFSRKAMMTIGTKMMPLTPITAWIVVMAHSIVLFLFSSESLEYFLASNGLPTIPLVPISSSQVIVGAIVGIGLLKGGQQLQWGVLLRIVRSWFTTPPIAMLVCLLMLTLAQNLFNITVYSQVNFRMTQAVMTQAVGLQNFSWQEKQNLKHLQWQTFEGSENFSHVLQEKASITDPEQLKTLISLSQLSPLKVQMHKLDGNWILALQQEQLAALQTLDGKIFEYRWQLENALKEQSLQWQPLPDTVLNKQSNNELYAQLDYLFNRLATNDRE